MPKFFFVTRIHHRLFPFVSLRRGAVRLVLASEYENISADESVPPLINRAADGRNVLIDDALDRDVPTDRQNAFSVFFYNDILAVSDDLGRNVFDYDRAFVRGDSELCVG